MPIPGLYGKYWTWARGRTFNISHTAAGRHALTDLQPDNFHGTTVSMVTVEIPRGQFWRAKDRQSLSKISVSFTYPSCLLDLPTMVFTNERDFSTSKDPVSVQDRARKEILCSNDWPKWSCRVSPLLCHGGGASVSLNTSREDDYLKQLFVRQLIIMGNPGPTISELRASALEDLLGVNSCCSL